jgi:hypothetical protein
MKIKKIFFKIKKSKLVFKMIKLILILLRNNKNKFKNFKKIIKFLLKN